MQRSNHLLQVLFKFLAILPVLRLRVVSTKFNDHYVGLEGYCVFPRHLVHIRIVALVEHGTGTDAKVLDVVVVAQQLLQLSRIAVDWCKVDAVAISNAVTYASHLDSVLFRCL